MFIVQMKVNLCQISKLKVNTLDLLIDICCHTSITSPSHASNLFYQAWHYIALQNSEIFDQLELSLYRSPDLQTYKTLLYRYEYPSYNDQNTREILQKLRGKLVLWPAEFLINEFLL